jgi:ABC-type Fe3+ transport system substrate-binding protein
MSERNKYEALLKIRNRDDLHAFVDWLKELRENARNQLETQVQGVQIAQGKAQVLKEILDAIESSPKVLEKLAK